MRRMTALLTQFSNHYKLQWNSNCPQLCVLLRTLTRRSLAPGHMQVRVRLVRLHEGLQCISPGLLQGRVVYLLWKNAATLNKREPFGIIIAFKAVPTKGYAGPHSKLLIELQFVLKGNYSMYKRRLLSAYKHNKYSGPTWCRMRIQLCEEAWEYLN